jgi:uncharacterized protein
MLDLSRIAIVDNHCHPVLLQQQMDLLQFRSYFSEASHPSFAEQHVANSVYYRWMLHQLTGVYNCLSREEEIVNARNSLQGEQLLQRLFQAANIDTLILDVAHPLPEQCYTSEQMAQAGNFQSAKMLRLETLMQKLVIAHSDFDEVVARFEEEIGDIRAKGYCSFKSIVAYRTGLNIQEWSKDQAVDSFAEARAVVQREGGLRIAHKPLIDYLLHKAFASASAQQVPVQFHTGYGDSDTDMRLGNPLQLRDILERVEYQQMKVVLLHESYPYSQLGAYLAAVYPHVYFDLSYTIPFVEKLEMLAFTRQALSVAPVSKLMYSSDGIHLPEMHWAGAIRGRAVIGQVLEEMMAADELDEEEAYYFAEQVLRGTAYSVYSLNV